MKILLYTDSRGQHKHIGFDGKLYGELLEEKYKVDAYYCPMKWTTIIDFLSLLNSVKTDDYDFIIAHVGIVDFSPRPLSSAVNDLYNPAQESCINNLKLNTQNYSEKIINKKKNMFDEIFGEENMHKHFSNPHNVTYLNERTINMYSLDMAYECLLPILKSIDKLIWISCNPFIPGWKGNYSKYRPINISIVEQYSDMLAANLKKVIDLSHWSDAEVRQYTCDNLHVTKMGSDYIYERIHTYLF